MASCILLVQELKAKGLTTEDIDHGLRSVFGDAMRIEVVPADEADDEGVTVDTRFGERPCPAASTALWLLQQLSQQTHLPACHQPAMTLPCSWPALQRQTSSFLTGALTECDAVLTHVMPNEMQIRSTTWWRGAAAGLVCSQVISPSVTLV
jgi:hypothetical protein